jgi:hypothetical protein
MSLLSSRLWPSRRTTKGRCIPTLEPGQGKPALRKRTANTVTEMKTTPLVRSASTPHSRLPAARLSFTTPQGSNSEGAAAHPQSRTTVRPYAVRLKLGSTRALNGDAQIHPSVDLRCASALSSSVRFRSRRVIFPLPSSSVRPRNRAQSRKSQAICRMNHLTVVIRYGAYVV